MAAERPGPPPRLKTGDLVTEEHWALLVDNITYLNRELPSRLQRNTWAIIGSVIGTGATVVLAVAAVVALLD